MTPEQAGSFLSEAEQTRHGALFALAFHTGCRPGELLAVRWPDLDTDAMTLRVWRNIKWPAGGKWYLDDPKTDSSRRALRLDGGIVERWPRTESASLRNA
jgi:integrase